MFKIGIYMKQHKIGHDKRGELVYGVHPIIEVLKAKRRQIITLYITKPEPSAWNRIKGYLPSRSPQLQYVTREVLDRLTNTTEHMGIAALVGAFPYRMKSFTPDKQPFLLLIDSVLDVRNLGAMLRSAHIIGIDGIIIARGRSAPLNAAALKASAGLAEHLEIYQTSSLRAALKDLIGSGYKPYMAVLEGGIDASTVTYDVAKVLVIGNEEKGISRELQGHGIKITIPQEDLSASLNASVATGILLTIMKYGLSRSE